MPLPCPVQAAQAALLGAASAQQLAIEKIVYDNMAAQAAADARAKVGNRHIRMRHSNAAAVFCYTTDLCEVACITRGGLYHARLSSAE